MVERMRRARLALPLGPLLAVHSAENWRCSCRTRQCAHPGKHPATPRGCHDATHDENVIERWLRNGFNLGLQCASVLVLDVDPRSGGDQTLKDLEAKYGVLPHTPMALTGGGGEHHFFRLQPNRRFKTTAGRGLDVKAGPGAYVIVDPSRHVSGGGYRWEDLPEHIELADPPSWLLDRIDRGDAPLDVAVTGLVGECLLARAFLSAGLARGGQGDRIFVECPWSHLHSSRPGPSDSSTVIFAPTARTPSGGFHCSHAHCDGRTATEALAALPVKAVVSALSELAVGSRVAQPEARNATLVAGPVPA